MPVDPLLVSLIIFFGISLCATLICYFIGKMYFITERYFKSRFIKKDDQQQQRDESPQMRTAESPSVDAPRANPNVINCESQSSTKIPFSNTTQGSSDASTSSYNSSSNNNNNSSSMNVSGS